MPDPVNVAALLKAARSRIEAMKIAPCAGLASSRKAAEEFERALDALVGLSDATRDAFEPFDKFMAGGSFDKLPDDMQLTAGSSIARQQIKAIHFRKLATAIAGLGGEL